MQGAGCRVQGAGCRVQGSGFRVQAATHRVPVLGDTLEREFFIDNLMVRIHLIIVMISVDRPCAMGV